MREESVDLSRNYTKVITEYESEKKKTEKKIIDDETDYEPLNKIYVEITKEYDENEKLIKKFVLRKNKFNAVRSETNFDFIKGEIVTKYYDGEKDFATVTETLIGKDRAIVKRERVGDEFVIWDYFCTNEIEPKFERYFIDKDIKLIKLSSNGEIKFKIGEYYELYNESKNGIEKNDFIFMTTILQKQNEEGLRKMFNTNVIYEFRKETEKVLVKEITNIKKIYSMEDLKKNTPIDDYLNYIYGINDVLTKKRYVVVRDYYIQNEEYNKYVEKFKKLKMEEE